MKRINLIILMSVFILSSCSSSKTLYSWYDYEDKAYQYQKKGEDELLPKTMKECLKVIEKQKGIRNTPPPGLNAEYGYMLYKLGKKEEALNSYKTEILLYPESEIYVSRIIKQLEQ